MTVFRRPDGPGVSMSNVGAVGAVVASGAIMLGKKIGVDIPIEVVTGFLGILGWGLRRAIGRK